MSLDQNWFLETISGKRTGIVATATRWLLLSISLVYRLVIIVRNWAFDKGWKRIYRVDLPVISIGNLTTGGTGKTPFVIWLANRLKLDHRVTVVSRGYGGKGGNLNDEGLEIESACSDVKLIQNPDRVAAVKSLEQRDDSVIILDDGFQHRRLHRDLDIVLIDALNPFGYGAQLPRGLLREPIASIRRSDLVVLTRCNLIQPAERTAIRHTLEKQHPRLNWMEAKLKLNGWRDLNDVNHSLETLNHRKLFAFCAIGNPSGFLTTLQQQNLLLVGDHPFNDHHTFSDSDLASIVRRAVDRNADAIVCTMKDFVKIRSNWKAQLPVYALTTGIEIVNGIDVIDQLLDQTLAELKNSRRDKSSESLTHR